MTGEMSANVDGPDLLLVGYSPCYLFEKWNDNGHL